MYAYMVKWWDNAMGIKYKMFCGDVVIFCDSELLRPSQNNGCFLSFSKHYH